MASDKRVHLFCAAWAQGITARDLCK